MIWRMIPHLLVLRNIIVCIMLIKSLFKLSCNIVFTFPFMIIHPWVLHFRFIYLYIKSILNFSAITLFKDTISDYVSNVLSLNIFSQIFWRTKWYFFCWISNISTTLTIVFPEEILCFWFNSKLAQWLVNTFKSIKIFLPIEFINISYCSELFREFSTCVSSSIWAFQRTLFLRLNSHLYEFISGHSIHTYSQSLCVTFNLLLFFIKFVTDFLKNEPFFPSFSSYLLEFTISVFAN